MVSRMRNFHRDHCQTGTSLPGREKQFVRTHTHTHTHAFPTERKAGVFLLVGERGWKRHCPHSTVNQRDKNDLVPQTGFGTKLFRTTLPASFCVDYRECYCYCTIYCYNNNMVLCVLLYVYRTTDAAVLLFFVQDFTRLASFPSSHSFHPSFHPSISNARRVLVGICGPRRFPDLLVKPCDKVPLGIGLGRSGEGRWHVLGPQPRFVSGLDNVENGLERGGGRRCGRR
mmetsp:Transcript_30337/g.71529  ORF Transcript_30337/g.71529 Transcript_30337/m.71529 type:complete len:228 (+) Transcript_30337:870-1553(+)